MASRFSAQLHLLRPLEDVWLRKSPWTVVSADLNDATLVRRLLRTFGCDSVLVEGFLRQPPGGDYRHHAVLAHHADEAKLWELSSFAGDHDEFLALGSRTDQRLALIRGGEVVHRWDLDPSASFEPAMQILTEGTVLEGSYRFNAFTE